MLVLVDLDDTLCNTWEAGKKTIAWVVPQFLLRRKFRALLYILLGKYRELEKSERMHTLDFDELVEALLRTVYPDISKDEVEEISVMLGKRFFSHLRLYPDALPFLRGLKRLGATTVLITDSSTEWQRRKIESLGMGEYFDDIIISGETGHSKFEDYNFRLALGRFPDDEVYVVGDRDETDMAGAKAVGAVGILIRRGYFKGRTIKNADYIVGNLIEALEVIKNEHKKRAKT